MRYDFDRPIDRLHSDSAKWGFYAPDVLPAWVADMDFESPAPIMDAVKHRLDHGVFGYAFDLPELRDAVCARLLRLYDWAVEPESLVLLPGLVSGLNVFTRAFGQPGDGVLINTPVYPPFLTAPTNQGQDVHAAAQQTTLVDGHLHYDIDFAALEAAITPQTKSFILCNPHNPTGRVYTREELLRIGDLCERHDLVLCSDEIHCELLLDDVKHIPIASLSPALAARTVTLLAPSKTFNIPALGLSLAIIPDPAVRAQMEKAATGIVPHVNVLGMYAALAAYTECDDWLAQLLAYLTANRDYAVEFITNNLPGITTTVPQATYLAWLDCRAAAIDGSPYEFFLKEAKVALNDGARFGVDGEGFVRLNLGCPRATLEEVLTRMRDALVK